MIKGISPNGLLDTYHAERHPVAARVLHDARPVAWVGDLTQLGLADALTTWFGPPAAA